MSYYMNVKMEGLEKANKYSGPYFIYLEIDDFNQELDNLRN